MRIPLVGRHWNISLTHCRLVGLQCAGTDPLDLQVFFAAFNSIYKKLVAEEPIVCDHTGNVIPGIRAPDVAILDVRHALPSAEYTGLNRKILHAPQIVAGAVMREVRKCSVKPVKIVCFAPMASFAILRLATMWKDVLDMPDIKGHLEERAKAAGMDLGGYVTEVCVCGFDLCAARNLNLG